MNIIRHVIITGCIFLFVKCSNTRLLTNDQVLYTGRGKIEIQNPQKVKDIGAVKSYVKSITANKVNNSLLGVRILPPVSLWIYNYARPKNEKKSGNWLYNSLSKPPILVSDINPEIRAKKIENELNNRGYFYSTATARVDSNARNPRKAKVSWSVRLYPPYHYNQIIFESPVDHLDTLLQGTEHEKTIESGDRFDLSTLKKARAGMVQNIQEQGYYFFLNDHISIDADSNIGEKKIDLFFAKKENLPASVLARYRINNISILLRKMAANDSVPNDTVRYKEVSIISPGKIIKPEILYRSVTFRKGDLYSLTSYRKTLLNLNNLGVFRLVNLFFDITDNDTTLRMLDIRIEILVPENVSLDFESNLVTKSTGFSGPAISAGIMHKNAFGGAEKLEIKLYGNVEWQWNKNYSGKLGSYSYEAGALTGLVFPRIIAPGFIKTRALLAQSTSLNGGFSILNRTAFYRLNSLKASLNYQWAWSDKARHTFYPLYLNSVELLRTTAEFDSIINSNIYIRRSFEEQFILGFRYEFAFDNKTSEKKDNYQFQAGIYTSGNLISLMSTVPDRNNPESRTFLNNIYAQFVKFTTDLRYYRNGINQSLAFRLYAGFGLPYGNSTVLPYVEQFFSGGAYSIRGFTARSLGPGGYHEATRYIDQSGDLKLEMNLEYRMKFTKLLNGALFIETGNVWLTHRDPARPGADFRTDNFLSQMAVGSGFGLRFDFSFFVLRTDLGLPLRTPYINSSGNWIGNFRDILRQSVFHLAVGYPF